MECLAHPSLSFTASQLDRRSGLGDQVVDHQKDTSSSFKECISLSIGCILHVVKISNERRSKLWRINY